MGKLRIAWRIGATMLFLVASLGMPSLSRGGQGEESKQESVRIGETCVSPRGLLASRDSEAHEQRAARGLDPEVIPLVLCAAPSDPHRLYLGTLRHGVYRSDDGGERWRSVSQGLPQSKASVARLLVHPEDADIVYAVTDLYGLYRTRDGGETWEPINRGLPVPFAYRTFVPLLAVNPENPSFLYVLLGAPVHSHRVDHALYRSSDEGETWEKVADLPDDVSFEGLRVSPRNPRELEILLEGKIVRILESEFDEEESLEILKGEEEVRISSALDFDAGDIAVLHDDGTLMHVFDLNGQTLHFAPVGTGGFSLEASDLLFEEEWGQKVNLQNDSSLELALPFAFPFYGRSWNRLFVNSNGNISFGQPRRAPNPSTLSDVPLIAPLWTDLDPGARGGVFFRATSERVVITWSDVPERNRMNSNTFQIVLERDGRFRMSFPRVEARTGLTGVFNGNVLAQVFFGRALNFSERLPLRDSTLPAVYELFDGVFQDEQIARRFYQKHSDDFDMLVVFGASSIPHDVTDGSFTSYKPIKNDVGGIGQGQGTFNGGPRAFGSQGRLQGFLNMNRISQYPADPEQVFYDGVYSALTLLARETGRRWLAYVDFNDGGNESSALRNFSSGWSFFLDTEASVMGGNNWVDNGDGTFESLEAALRYSALDQYLMGVRSPRDVPDFFLIIPPSDYTRRMPSSRPEVGIIVPGTAKMITLRQIAEVEGWRTPSYPQAPRHFRQAFILVVPQGETVSATDLEKLDRLRQEWEIFFRIATGGRARLSTRLRP